jgi:branched-chain amino acid transport system ATP-binding protein
MDLHYPQMKLCFPPMVSHSIGPGPAARPRAISMVGIEHRYDGVLALSGVTLDIAEGSFVAILGPNGAGKSTLALIMSGMMRPTRGEVSVPGVAQGRGVGAGGFVRQGIVLVPEGRRLFGQLTVVENLVLGAYGVGCDRAETARRMATVMDLMPLTVRESLNRAAVTLSGGEQQMLAIGRALMAAPRILIVDEPSLGLAPILIEKAYALFAKLNREGVTIVVIEQIATHAVRYAQNIIVLDRGTVVHAGAVSDAGMAEALRIGYLGRVAERAGNTVARKAPT